jgi:hypothetical protein
MALNPLITSHRLRFEVRGDRLVLAAILRVDGAGLDQAEKAKRAAWVEDAFTQADAARRCPPSPRPAPPTRADVDLLRGLASGMIAWHDVVDPVRGLVIGSWPNEDPSDETPSKPKPKGRRLCGAKLRAEAPKLRAKLTRLLRTTLMDSEVGCTAGANPSCELSEGDTEWANDHYLVFRSAPDGHLVLDTWFDFDDRLTDAAYQAEQRAWAEAFTARAHRRGCPGSDKKPR